MRMRLASLLDHEKEEETTREKSRETKLHEAALNGSLTSLFQLLHEDPLILTRLTPSPSSPESPLHVAALLGHLHFVRELLNRKPDLAGSLNSSGSTPLHAASAKGYVDIVGELVSVNPDACFVLDRDGRSPLHLAAIKGRVAVLTELVRVMPEAPRVLTGAGETCLHLCAKYNRLEALRLLIESVKKDEFVNWKDGDGNTILHLAVAKKQIEMVRFLLATTAIEVSMRNVNGLTALDVLSQGPRDLRDMEIKAHLHGCGFTARFNGAPPSIVNCDIAEVPFVTGQRDLQNDSSAKEQQPKMHKHTDWLGRKRSALMVVASLIATVAFQAAISPPGGVWQDDYTEDSNGDPVEKPHEAGKSVLAFNIPKAYGLFMIFDTIAFLASLSIILLQISGLPMRRRRWMWSQMVTMWIAITAQTVTYLIAFVQISPKQVEGTLFQVAKISVLTWLTLMALVFIGNLIRVILGLLRKYGYIKERESDAQEDDENDDL